MNLTNTTQDNETSGDVTPDLTGGADHVILNNPLTGTTTFQAPDGLAGDCLWFLTYTLASGVMWGEEAFVAYDEAVYKSGGSGGGGNGLTFTVRFLRVAGINFRF
jgi:hypothetical protein